MKQSNQTSNLAKLQNSVDIALQQLKTNNTVERLWSHDATLWKKDPENAKVIQNRLGWLDSVDWLKKQVPDLLSFQKEVVAARFSHAVLLGMGGSSLAPEVFSQTFGPVKNMPRLIVLDSTDPDQVLQVEKQIDLLNTLFIVSTKSGTTLETLSFYRYFFEKVKSKRANQAGSQFVAITDSGTPLEKEANLLQFRRVFVNPTNIGGRFSVLSYFGMVPACVMGVDVKTLIDRIGQEKARSTPQTSDGANPGCFLGVVMAEAVKQGRDKLTIFMALKISSYGLWIEQLLAESLGKEGKGIVPIFGETPMGSTEYQNDRLFVFLHCGPVDSKTITKIKELQKASCPVIEINLADPYDLGEQFYRWAFATAIAGSLLGINPFDEPNVQEAKTWTNSLLKELKDHGKFPDFPNHFQGKNYFGTFGNSTCQKIAKQRNLAAFFKLVKPGDYISLGAYLPYEPEIEKKFVALRQKLKDKTKYATMFGFGPRYLHSTGQLHKGGPNSCVMILFTADSKANAAIPGQPFGFRELEYAQGMGDFRALDAKARRVVRLHLKQPISNALVEVEKLFDQTFSASF
ncbi:MAG: glucose-6-phosphate isomerase [Candidatus Omnitrophica bacterium]|nr:glucose-6-phosphate isomerase [Candidatus Omnitrophota bacterium]